MRKEPCRYASASHPGVKRENNEDRVYCDPERGIFIVVDGMGGQAAGERASEIAVTRLRARLERPTGSAVERIREAITLANNEIHQQACENPAWNGMACVLSVALIEKDRVTIGHVGDTRIYKLYAGQFRKLTHDHSPIGIREERGDLSELEAMRHPRRNEVFRDVGSEPRTPQDETFIEILEEDFEPGSALLLCSDGLTDLLTASRIQGILEEWIDHPDEIVGRLIDAANDAGGDDNISVIWIENADVVDAGLATVRRARAGYTLTFLLGVLFGGLLFGIGQYVGGRWYYSQRVLSPAAASVNLGTHPDPSLSPKITPSPPVAFSRPEPESR